jgi:ATP-dependent DNA helicase RecG
VSIDRPENDLLGILAELRKLPKETEWAEFKHNNAEPEEIGEYLSALANAAALTGTAL